MRQTFGRIVFHDIVLCGIRRENVENKLEEWRRAMEDMGLTINRKKTAFLRFTGDGNSDNFRRMWED